MTYMNKMLDNQAQNINIKLLFLLFILLFLNVIEDNISQMHDNIRSIETILPHALRFWHQLHQLLKQKDWLKPSQPNIIQILLINVILNWWSIWFHMIRR